MSGSRTRFSKCSMSGNQNYRVLRFLKNRIILSTAQDSSVFPICIYSKLRNTRLPDMEYFENLVRKLATSGVLKTETLKTPKTPKHEKEDPFLHTCTFLLLHFTREFFFYIILRSILNSLIPHNRGFSGETFLLV